jgi:hypothetical protein
VIETSDELNTALYADGECDRFTLKITNPVKLAEELICYDST